MPDPRIPGKYTPGIRTSRPHESSDHPETHVDIEFIPGRIPGQLPLPYPKIHVPVPGSGKPSGRPDR